MPRALSVTLAGQLANVVTSVGYLVQIDTTSTLRFCNTGTVTWNGVVWADAEFSVSGLDFNTEATMTGTLSMQNLDNSMSGFLLNESVADAQVQVWQFERGALGTGDVPKLAVMAIDGCSIGPQSAVLQLVEAAALTAFAPRRSINQTFGFFRAIPAGTVIAWENEVATMEQSDG